MKTESERIMLYFIKNNEKKEVSLNTKGEH